MTNTLPYLKPVRLTEEVLNELNKEKGIEFWTVDSGGKHASYGRKFIYQMRESLTHIYLPVKELRSKEEATEKIKPSIAIAEREAEYIPYQCCPVCNGSGQVLASNFTSGVFQVCSVCNGQKTILMFKSQTNK